MLTEMMGKQLTTERRIHFQKSTEKQELNKRDICGKRDD